jgi:hypothetical protein
VPEDGQPAVGGVRGLAAGGDQFSDPRTPRLDRVELVDEQLAEAVDVLDAGDDVLSVMRQRSRPRALLISRVAVFHSKSDVT